MGGLLLSFEVLRVQKKELKSVGIPLGPAGCIIIGNILVENMPKEKLLALSEHCLKSHRIFESKLLCFFGLSGITVFFLFFYLTLLMDYALTSIRIHQYPLIIYFLFSYKSTVPLNSECYSSHFPDSSVLVMF